MVSAVDQRNPGKDVFQSRWCTKSSSLPAQHCCCLVPQSCLTLWPLEWQHTRFPHPSPPPRACSNSCPLSGWCHPTVSSSVTLFFCLQSFPASGSFPMRWFFASGGQSIGASVLVSALPVNVQGWFPLGLTAFIFLLSEGGSRVFSNTTVWKHQFFSTQPSWWPNSKICTWLLEKSWLWL